MMLSKRDKIYHTDIRIRIRYLFIEMELETNPPDARSMHILLDCIPNPCVSGLSPVHLHLYLWESSTQQSLIPTSWGQLHQFNFFISHYLGLILLLNDKHSYLPYHNPSQFWLSPIGAVPQHAYLSYSLNDHFFGW